MTGSSGKDFISVMLEVVLLYFLKEWYLYPKKKKIPTYQHSSKMGLKSETRLFF